MVQGGGKSKQAPAQPQITLGKQQDQMEEEKK